MTANSFIILVVAFAARLTVSEAFVLPTQTCKTYSSLHESILQTDAVTSIEGEKRNDDEVLVPELMPLGSDIVSSRRLFVSTAAIAASAIVLSNEPANAETMAAASASAKQLPSAQQILQQSAKKAISGGKAGATASIFQVLSLMWLRTSMNYQYRYGGTLGSSLSDLYQEGGVGRLYQGLPFALIQGPLTRFGDTVSLYRVRTVYNI